jgi:hypothetical protein
LQARLQARREAALAKWGNFEFRMSSLRTHPAGEGERDWEVPTPSRQPGKGDKKKSSGGKSKGKGKERRSQGQAAWEAGTAGEEQAEEEEKQRGEDGREEGHEEREEKSTPADAPAVGGG